jgi:hypothetical protein
VDDQGNIGKSDIQMYGHYNEIFFFNNIMKICKINYIKENMKLCIIKFGITSFIFISGSEDPLY